MDKIHDPEGRAWISEPIVVGDYFREYSELVEKEKPLVDMSGIRSKWTMKHMGMEDKELFSQVTVCYYLIDQHIFLLVRSRR